MAASRPNWPGVRMLHRLRTRVAVFGATNENRHQTETTTRPLSNWDKHRSVRRSANLSFSRTRSGVVTDASPAFLQGPHFHRMRSSGCVTRISTATTRFEAAAISLELRSEMQFVPKRPRIKRSGTVRAPRTCKAESRGHCH